MNLRNRVSKDLIGHGVLLFVGIALGFGLSFLYWTKGQPEQMYTAATALTEDIQQEHRSNGDYRTFVHPEYQYSFDYPASLVLQDDGTKVTVSERHNDDFPLLEFSIITPAEENRVISQITETVRGYTAMQDQNLAQLSRNQRVSGHGIPSLNVQPFTGKNAIGFQTLGDSHRSIFIHLLDGHVLVITEREMKGLCAQSPIVEELLDTVDPFGGRT